MTAATAYVAAYLADDASGTWPFDTGDDPSFASSLRVNGLQGRVSWGICRSNLRNRVQPGDLIIFFAAEKREHPAQRAYRLSGWLTVDRKVSQVDIWDQDDLSRYRNYINLLIRPVVGTKHFEHHEPGPTRWHDDWLWRIAHPSRRQPVKDEWEVAGRTARLVDGQIDVGGWRLRPAANYVLFTEEGDHTYVLADPPEVAVAWARPGIEEWHDDEISQRLRETILSGHHRQGLRTRNPFQPHQYLRLPRPANVIRDELAEICTRFSLMPRS